MQASTRGVDPYLLRKFGPAKRAAGGQELRFNCPECINRRHNKGVPDTEFKLQVNPLEGVFYCQRCRWSGKLEWLYTEVEVQRQKLVTWKDEVERFLGGQIDDPPPVSPDDWMMAPLDSNWDGTLHYQYLCDRLKSIPSYEVESLITSGQVRMGQGSRYLSRLFFLDIYHGSIRYWAARSIVDFIEPKYLSPYGVGRYSVLYNQEYIERTHPAQVIICEGVISSIVAGLDSIATFGRVLTDGQLSLLRRLNASRYYIASEAEEDARKDTVALAEYLRRWGCEVFIIWLPYKQDPASLGRDNFRALLDDAEQYTWTSYIFRRLYGQLSTSGRVQ